MRLFTLNVHGKANSIASFIESLDCLLTSATRPSPLYSSSTDTPLSPLFEGLNSLETLWRTTLLFYRSSYHSMPECSHRNAIKSFVPNREARPNPFAIGGAVDSTRDYHNATACATYTNIQRHAVIHPVVYRKKPIRSGLLHGSATFPGVRKS